VTTDDAILNRIDKLERKVLKKLMALADQITNLQQAEASERQAISTAASRIDAGFATLIAELAAGGVDSSAINDIISNMQQDTAAIASIALQSAPPLPITPAAVLNSILVSSATLPGNSEFTGTVELSAPAPEGGFTVALSSSDPSVVLDPLVVTIAEGDESGPFTGTAETVEVPTPVVISFYYSLCSSALCSSTCSSRRSSTCTSALGGAA
jgi:hypothetical protein